MTDARLEKERKTGHLIPKRISARPFVLLRNRFYRASPKNKLPDHSQACDRFKPARVALRIL